MSRALEDQRPEVKTRKDRVQGAQGPLVLSPARGTTPRLFEKKSPSPLLRQRLGYRVLQGSEPGGQRLEERWEGY